MEQRTTRTTARARITVWFTRTSLMGIFGRINNLLLIVVTFRPPNLSSRPCLLLGHLFLYFVLCTVTLRAPLLVARASIFDIQVSNALIFCAISEDDRRGFSEPQT